MMTLYISLFKLIPPVASDPYQALNTIEVAAAAILNSVTSMMCSAASDVMLVSSLSVVDVR